MDLDSIEFTEDEIQEELSRLGYQNVPEEKLREFKRDLQKLIRHERSRNTSVNTSLSSQAHVDTSLSSGGRGAVQRERVPFREMTDYKRQDVYPTANNYGKENQYDFTKTILPGPRLGQLEPQFSRYDTRRDTSHLQQELRDDISETDSERRMVKRKTLRKNDKGSKFIDESMTESDAGSIIDANERLQRLALRDSDDLALLRRPKSARDNTPYRLSPDDTRPASVILRPADHPHTRNVRKSDPVARYQQFRQVWQVQKAPGEKDHKGLRWNIREQMLVQDSFEKKPQKVFVANKYVVPTEKKRTSLRWQIRMDLAQGNMPPCGFFHEY